jgi:FtsH-binding integral membrane protein
MEKIDSSNKRELVEKLRAEYYAIQNKQKRISKILLLIGIGLLISGIVLVIIGFSSMFDGEYGIGWLGPYLGGIFMAMAGLLMTIFNVIRSNLNSVYLLFIISIIHRGFFKIRGSNFIGTAHRADKRNDNKLVG